MVMKNGQLMLGKRSLRQDQSPRLWLPLPYAVGWNLAQLLGQNGEHLANPPARAGMYLDHLQGLCPLV